jgi:hypothetical protein
MKPTEIVETHPTLKHYEKSILEVMQVAADYINATATPENHAQATTAIDNLNAAYQHYQAAIHGMATVAAELKKQRNTITVRHLRLRVDVQSGNTENPDVAELVNSIKEGLYEVETLSLQERLHKAHGLDHDEAEILLDYLLDNQVLEAADYLILAGLFVAFFNQVKTTTDNPEFGVV